MRRARIPASLKPCTKRLQLDSTRFTERYYNKHAIPRERSFRASSLRQWLEKSGLACEGARANVTLFDGGNFHVPPHMAREYHHMHAQDVLAGNPVCVNERTVGLDKVALALELDYRFSFSEYGGAQGMEAHLDCVVRTLGEFYKGDNGARAMIFTCDPKPKKSDQSWKVAMGYHIIVNRLVTFEEGAQISHRCGRELVELDPTLDDVVDNIYIKQGNYSNSAALRPPLSSKLIPCFYCNDHTVKKKKTGAVRCKTCSQTGRVLDGNTYRLVSVRSLDGREDTELLGALQADMARMLSLATIWGTELEYRRPTIGRPYTLEQMCPVVKAVAPSQPKPRPKRVGLAVVNGGDKTIEFRNMHVKDRSDKGRKIPIKPIVNEAIQSLLLEIDGGYEGCEVSAVELFSYHAARINVNSTLCMTKGENHNSNRVHLWVVYKFKRISVYAGCFSHRCGGLYTDVSDRVDRRTVRVLFEVLRGS